MPPLVVELLGPAGAGKSTLARDLRARDPRIRRPIGLWGLPLWALLRSAASLVPACVATLLRRPLAFGQLAQMVRLGALCRVVAREARRRESLVLLDEGPIFGLAWLDVFFPRDDDPAIRRWRRGLLRAWRPHLHAVVRLDAPDAVLAHRIRTRSKPHPVKAWSDAAIGEFTARFRTAFEHTLDELSATRPLVILALTTDGRVPGEAATQVVAGLRGTARVH